MVKEKALILLLSKIHLFLELHGTPGHPKLTVGKVYAICLYMENYRSYKQGHTNDMVSLSSKNLLRFSSIYHKTLNP